MSEPKSSKAEYKSLDNAEGPVVEAVAVAPAPMPQVVEVVAPSDLPPGYQLSVDVNGRVLVIGVPEGGVKQGQRFQGQVLHEKTFNKDNGHNIPFGAWRDGICDCCAHGCCHPSLCLSYWCEPLAVGQILTRMGLNWCATPSGRHPGGMSPFRLLLWAWIACMVIDQALSLLVRPYTATEVQYDEYGYPVGVVQNGGEPVPGWVTAVTSIQTVIELGFAIYMLIIAIKARNYIRGKYSIPGSGCEDCCCVFWCGCCSISQMLRHTADYNSYKASCCTDTGLPPTAPSVV